MEVLQDVQTFKRTMSQFTSVETCTSMKSTYFPNASFANFYSFIALGRSSFIAVINKFIFFLSVSLLCCTLVAETNAAVHNTEHHINLLLQK